MLSDIDCRIVPEKCTSICRQDEPVGFFARGCRSEVFHFCVSHHRHLARNYGLTLWFETGFNNQWGGGGGGGRGGSTMHFNGGKFSLGNYFAICSPTKAITKI